MLSHSARSSLIATKYSSFERNGRYGLRSKKPNIKSESVTDKAQALYDRFGSSIVSLVSEYVKWSGTVKLLALLLVLLKSLFGDTQHLVALWANEDDDDSVEDGDGGEGDGVDGGGGLMLHHPFPDSIWLCCTFGMLHDKHTSSLVIDRRATYQVGFDKSRE